MTDTEHKYIYDLLSAYLDKELEPMKTEAVRRHLEICTECQKELERLRSIDQLVQQHGDLDGSDYWEKSAQTIEQKLGIAETVVTDIKQRKEKTKSGTWMQIAGVAASVAILTFIGIHHSDILDSPLDSKIESDKIQAPSVLKEAPALEPAQAISKEATPPLESAPVQIGEIVPKEETSGHGRIETESGDLSETLDNKNYSSASESLEAGTDDLIEITVESSPVLKRDNTISGNSMSIPSSKVIEKPKGEEIEVEGADYKPQQEKGAGNVLEKKKSTLHSTRRKVISRDETSPVKPVDVELEPVISIQKSASVAMLRQTDLIHWRNIRDSLSQPTKPKAKKSSEAIRSLAPIETQAPASDSLLMEAWYHIIQLSSDSTEIDRGVEYLNKTASSEQKELSAKAQYYLKELGY